MVSKVVATASNPSGEPETKLESSGLTFFPARSVEEVAKAWELVYYSYCQAGLISENPFEVHTVPQAIDEKAVVIIGRSAAGEIASTMSSYVDRPEGLPLDHIYADQMNAMRGQGCRLMEIGLFADRRRSMGRSLSALLELMRYNVLYAPHNDLTDIVIGVHPHHADFYRRLFAFRQFADVAGCPSVNGSPMVPLRLDLRRNMKLDPLPRALKYFQQHPLTAEAYADRVELTPDGFDGTAVQGFLQLQARPGD